MRWTIIAAACQEPPDLPRCAFYDRSRFPVRGSWDVGLDATGHAVPSSLPDQDGMLLGRLSLVGQSLWHPMV